MCVFNLFDALFSYSTPNFDSKTSIASYELGTRPDSLQGYGAINLHSVVPLSVSDREETDLYVKDKFNIPSYSTWKLDVTVESSKKPLKVTIVSEVSCSAEMS